MTSPPPRRVAALVPENASGMWGHALAAVTSALTSKVIEDNGGVESVGTGGGGTRAWRLERGGRGGAKARGAAGGDGKGMACGGGGPSDARPNVDGRDRRVDDRDGRSGALLI